jgi:hypothetical protein
MGGEGVVSILRFQGGSPRLCWLKTASFWPRWARFDLYWPYVRFTGPGKPSSPVTTLSNRHSLLWDGLLEGEWDNPRWWSGRTIGRGQDFFPRVGAQIPLSRDSADGCCTWNQQAKHTMCWLGSFPAGCTPIQITVTLSDMSDHLSLLSSHSMFYYIDGMH